VTGIFNFSDKVVRITPQNKEVKGEYRDIFTGKTMKLSPTRAVEMKPWEVVVLKGE
jgi:hypothetical protein